VLPKVCITGREQRVLAGVPAQEMRRMDMPGVRFAAAKLRAAAARRVHRLPGEDVGEAASSLRDGADQRAQFRFQQRLLPLAPRRETISVTAFFGSFPPAAPRVFRALRLGFLAPAFLALRFFAMLAGIVTQTAQGASVSTPPPAAFYWG